MQRLQVRFYSISSSPLMHPKSIHITCAVVYEKTVTGVLAPPRCVIDPLTGRELLDNVTMSAAAACTCACA